MVEDCGLGFLCEAEVTVKIKNKNKNFQVLFNKGIDLKKSICFLNGKEKKKEGLIN